MANISTLFMALGDPTRRKLFERLAKHGGPHGGLPVGRLARGIPVSRPAVSQHLKVLKDAGLVVVREEGTRRIYQIDERGIQAMHAYLDRMWDHALAAFKSQVEK